MIELIRRFAIRAVVRPALVLTTAGSMSSFGASFKDLRNELPSSGEYRKRKIEDVRGVVWHHSATDIRSTPKSLADYHVNFRNWPRIGYHYAIDYNGIIYIMNDPTRISYQASGFNSSTIGVVLIGNYNKDEITPLMKESILKMQEYLKNEYKLEFSWYHGETKSTACPGRNAIKLIKTIQYGRRPNTY